MLADTLNELSRQLGLLLLARCWHITCAESCTGGHIAATITATPGSSAYFSHGFVTYSDTAKQQGLGVQATTLAGAGAVSQLVAQEMAQGAQRLAGAEVAVAVTGIAGPGGGSEQKPVGLVCFAWAMDNAPVLSVCHQFWGDRAAVRQQATYYALLVLCNKLRTPGVSCL
jgi:nicotinamide-nucleotide amidase